MDGLMHLGPVKYLSASCELREFEPAPELKNSIREVTKLNSVTRKCGHARALMLHVCEMADLDRITLVLMPEAEEGGMPQEALIKFYEKLGFVTIQDEPQIMARAPLPEFQVKQWLKTR